MGWKKGVLQRHSGLLAIGVVIIYSFASCTSTMPSQERIRPRIVVTTDPECDDSNSLVRFLLYSTDFQVEGLIYASSQFHWKGDGRGTKWFVEGREYTRFGLNMGPMESWRWPEGDSHIEDAVEVYGRVYPNLKAHDPDYPSPGELESKIRYGNIEFDGDISKDSPGSDLIKSLMLDDVPGPLYITAWGGQSTIARALKSIQEQYENTPEWESIREKVSSKVVLLPSGDQDDVYANYIRPNWPEIDYRQFSSGAGFGYGAQSRATAENAVYYTSSWMNEHISSQGPLGAFYRVWGDGKQMVEGDIFDYFGFSGYTDDELREMGYIVWLPVQEKGSWLGEGDTPTFMNLLDNGLRAYEDASYGGWGGYRLTASAAGLSPWQGDFGGASLQGAQGATGPGYPDFFQEAQNDFVTRLHWSVTPEYAEANHEPEASIEGPLSVTAHPGETVRLAGEVSDPDGDPVSIKWWEFQAADSYEGEVTIASPTSASTDVVVPADAEPGQTIHMILEVTDNAPLPLTRYQRVIITVQGE